MPSSPSARRTGSGSTGVASLGRAGELRQAVARDGGQSAAHARKLDAMRAVARVRQHVQEAAAQPHHAREERHVHLVCRGCGVVLELTDDALTDVAAEIERTTGFVIEPSHFAINGRCAACAATT